MASNNDCGIREYDMEKFQLLNHFRFPWPVNVSHPKNLIHIDGFGQINLPAFVYFYTKNLHIGLYTHFL